MNVIVTRYQPMLSHYADFRVEKHPVLPLCKGTRNTRAIRKPLCLLQGLSRTVFKYRPLSAASPAQQSHSNQAQNCEAGRFGDR